MMLFDRQPAASVVSERSKARDQKIDRALTGSWFHGLDSSANIIPQDVVSESTPSHYQSVLVSSDRFSRQSKSGVGPTADRRSQSRTGMREKGSLPLVTSAGRAGSVSEIDGFEGGFAMGGFDANV